MFIQKIKRSDFDRIHLGSDFHLEHDREFVWGVRGYACKDTHRQAIEEHVAGFGPNDLFIYGGDLALNSSVDYVREFLRSIPCQTYIVWGNHNAGLSQIYKAELELQYQLQGVELFPLDIFPHVKHFGESFYLQIDKRGYQIQHIAPLIWDKQAWGVAAICGHSHGRLEGANVGNDFFGKLLDVGVDNAIKYNGTPTFSIEEVNAIVDAKKIKEWDYHGTTAR